jgi:hypothetical protein
MFHNRIPKHILERYLGGRRPSGKLRSRWEDEVPKDAAKLLNTKNRRAAARHTGVIGRRKQGKSWPGNGAEEPEEEEEGEE